MVGEIQTGGGDGGPLTRTSISSGTCFTTTRSTNFSTGTSRSTYTTWPGIAHQREAIDGGLGWVGWCYLGTLNRRLVGRSMIVPVLPLRLIIWILMPLALRLIGRSMMVSVLPLRLISWSMMTMVLRLIGRSMMVSVLSLRLISWILMPLALRLVCRRRISVLRLRFIMKALVLLVVGNKVRLLLAPTPA